MRELKGVTKAGGIEVGAGGGGWATKEGGGGVYSKTMQLLLVFCYEQRSPDHTGRFHNCFFLFTLCGLEKGRRKKKVECDSH